RDRCRRRLGGVEGERRRRERQRRLERVPPAPFAPCPERHRAEQAMSDCRVVVGVVTALVDEADDVRARPALVEERRHGPGQPSRAFEGAVEADVVVPAAHLDRDRTAANDGDAVGKCRPHARRAARGDTCERARIHAHAGECMDRRLRELVDARSAESDRARHQTYVTPSWTRCSSSIATSPPPLAASVGPTHFFGWTFTSFHAATGLRASSRSVIVTLLESNVPACTAFNQSNRSVEPTRPRLSVTSSSLCVFATLRTVFDFSLPFRYSE